MVLVNAWVNQMPGNGPFPETNVQAYAEKTWGAAQQRRLRSMLSLDILLVEDQIEVRQPLRLLLGLEEHSVTEACTGREALELYGQAPYDLIITDYSMPEMNGDELARRIKQVSPTQPILMITAHVENLDVPGNPVDAILKKPFTFQELRAAIAQLIG